MTARASRRRVGKCPGCDKTLNDGQPVDHVIGDVGGWHETSPGNFRKSSREGKIEWHASCLADFRTQAERSRCEALLSHDIQTMLAFAGAVDPEVIIKAMRDNGRTDEHIATVLKAVQEGQRS